MRKNLYPARYVFLIVGLLLVCKNSRGQSYGLGFSSHEVVQDKRTSLDLSPDKPIAFKNNTELSFDLSFVPNMHTYFGYVIRIIQNDKLNIDLVYDVQSTKGRFNVIIGDKLSHINFDIPQGKLLHKWNNIRIRFDLENDKITLYNDGRSFTENGLGLEKGGGYKILFGANKYKQFATTDVPPVRLKDVKIVQAGSVKYQWPLNEDDGLVAHEVITQNDGVVVNPLWITAMHRDWQMAANIKVKGAASIAADIKNELLYIMAGDSVYSFSIANGRWNDKAYKAGDVNFNIGNQSIYNEKDHKIYNVLPEQPVMPAYSVNSNSWNIPVARAILTNYWQFNKFFSVADTSVYVFGGYGHLLYRNTIQRYNLNTKQWQKISPKGDFFTPRYLAALGATEKGDTVYIIGGYGNNSGKQILNPKNIYDVMRFTVKDSSFKKLSELKINDEDFAFGNSLIIDEKTRSYYGLVFPEHRYNSNLQLVKGSFNSATVEVVGGTIPYAFHDIHSFADLYYFKDSKKFVAVSLLRSQDVKTTVVNIYTLLGPPLPLTKKISAKKENNWLAWSALLLIVAGGVTWYIRKRTGGKKITVVAPASPVVNPVDQPDTVQESWEPVLQQLMDRHRSSARVVKNSIFLFGDLQVFDATGADITKYFTPLIKELFLVIMLYSIRWDRGLSSEKLNEILWYDKSAKSASNNRSVNITKLKTLLDKLEYCHLSKDTGSWKIDIDHDHVYVDYYFYLEIIKNKEQLDLQIIKVLTNIVRRGNFLSNIEYEWLDPFKSEISNDVIDNFLHFVHSENYLQNPELLIEIASFIFYFDPVNEEAMVIKCKALSALGKHSLARNTFENFSKEYRSIYGEEFKKDFHAISE